MMRVRPRQKVVSPSAPLAFVAGFARSDFGVARRARLHRLVRFARCAAFGVVLVACSSSNGGGPPSPNDAANGDDASTETSADVTPDAADGAFSDDASFATQRQACTFAAGALPKDTFGPSIAQL